MNGINDVEIMLRPLKKRLCMAYNARPGDIVKIFWFWQKGMVAPDDISGYLEAIIQLAPNKEYYLEISGRTHNKQGIVFDPAFSFQAAIEQVIREMHHG